MNTIIELVQELDHLEIIRISDRDVEFKVGKKILAISPDGDGWYYSFQKSNGSPIAEDYDFETLEDLLEAVVNECII